MAGPRRHHMWVCSGARKGAFVTRSQVTPVFLAQKPHSENHWHRWFKLPAKKKRKEKGEFQQKSWWMVFSHGLKEWKQVLFLLNTQLQWFPVHVLVICRSEGNGTPLQYSCLENPMDGGAWWAAVHGVARSRTQLKRLSSSSSSSLARKESQKSFSVLYTCRCSRTS